MFADPPSGRAEASRPLRYVAIGDSLSEGIGDRPWPDGSPRGWTDRLARLLHDAAGSAGRDFAYANLAIRGYRAAQVRDTQRAAAVAMAPDLVTLSAGMNDILRPAVDFDMLRATLIDIVTPLVERGTRVVVIPIPDLSRVSPAGRLINGRRLRLNQIYRDLSTHHGVQSPTETAGTVFEDPRAWADDRLHLSPLGHERLAYAAAAGAGLPIDLDWAACPPGPAPRRTLRTESTWWWRHVTPWLGRRVRGRSSGDGRSSKRPELLPLDPA